jgi:hypothetical protein
MLANAAAAKRFKRGRDLTNRILSRFQDDFTAMSERTNDAGHGVQWFWPTRPPLECLSATLIRDQRLDAADPKRRAGREMKHPHASRQPPAATWFRMKGRSRRSA